MLPLLLALILAVPAAAQAQDTGTYRSGPLDWGVEQGRAWVDFNADGKADYCRVTAANVLQCTLATGRGFGATIEAPPHDPGYADGRLWGDVDGNGTADYCRRVDGVSQRVECTLSLGNAFAFTPAPGVLEWGEVPGLALADVTGDRAADLCRVTTDRAICSPWTATGFGPGFGAPVAVGDADGRAWVDFNADGRADFCRVLPSTLACTLSTGSGFGATISEATTDVGYPDGRTWADINGDGRADYCRRVGGAPPETYIRCTLATPTGFGADFTSARLEWGDEAGTTWVDFNGDGYRDFCRPVAPTATNTQLFCTLWTPAGFGTTIVSGPTDLGYADGRAWVDHNGDGRADYCRVIGGGADRAVSCTTSIGTAFGPVPEPAPPAPPPPPPAPAPAPPKTRLAVTISWDHKVTGSWTRFLRLQVKGVPAGATVKVTCKKGCSRKKYTVKKKQRGTVSLKTVVRKRVKAGTTIRVVVSRPGNLAAIKTMKTRRGKGPTVKTG